MKSVCRFDCRQSASTSLAKAVQWENIFFHEMEFGNSDAVRVVNSN